MSHGLLDDRRRISDVAYERVRDHCVELSRRKIDARAVTGAELHGGERFLGCEPGRNRGS